MSANAGPDIVEDGIVFYYDTGNTVKSYIGEPTTNLVGTIATHYGGNVSTSYANGQYQTNAIVINGTDSSVPSGNYSRFNGTTADTNSQTYWTIQGNAVVNEANQTVSFSVYLKGNGTCHLATYNDHSGYQVGPDITLTDTWTKYSITKTIGTFTDYHWVAVRGIITSTDVFISSAQWERKSHATQYTPSSRSATQGLLDMTRNGTVDITNVSFDSDAQIVFDGTNDTVTVNSYPAIELTDNVSIEYVYMRLATDPILDVIANKYHSTGWELFCTTANTFALGGRNGDGTYYATSNAAYSIQNDKYYHLVAIKEGLSWRLYVNGELYAYLTAGSIGTWSNNGILQIGGEGSSYYPNMKLPLLKIYNRVLSVSEIQTNYNALKTRFGI